MEFERQNPHWEKDFYYNYEKKRFIFDKIQKSIETGLITALYGLRRVGKSVIMKQNIDQLIKQGVERKNILYFSFDENREEFWNVIKEYEKILGKRISQKNYLFFDEIQKVEDWKAKIKKLYDSSTAHIILSGSNSSMLRKGTESLAGRISEFFISELSFKEFLHFKNKDELYGSQFEERVEISFWEYIRKPFPELVLNESIDPKNYVTTIARKIIYEDLPEVFPIDEPQLLYKLFSLICANPGIIIAYDKMGSDLGRDRKTISRYLDYLRYGFMIMRLFNFSRNMLTSEKRLKKFYPSLACFVEAEDSRIIETAVAQTLKTKFFWNHKDRYEVDFVISEPLIALEVKYRDEVRQEDWNGLSKFKNQYSAAKTLLVGRKKGKDILAYYSLENFLESMGIIMDKNMENMVL